MSFYLPNTTFYNWKPAGAGQGIPVLDDMEQGGSSPPNLLLLQLGCMGCVAARLLGRGAVTLETQPGVGVRTSCLVPAPQLGLHSTGLPLSCSRVHCDTVSL